MGTTSSAVAWASLPMKVEGEVSVRESKALPFGLSWAGMPMLLHAEPTCGTQDQTSPASISSNSRASPLTGEDAHALNAFCKAGTKFVGSHLGQLRAALRITDSGSISGRPLGMLAWTRTVESVSRRAQPQT